VQSFLIIDALQEFANTGVGFGKVAVFVAIDFFGL
jgi:hypothetical protein